MTRCSGTRLERIGQIPHEERMTYVHSLTSRLVAHLPYPVWGSITSSTFPQPVADGCSTMAATCTSFKPLVPADIKANFPTTGEGDVSDLGDETWYLVEAWDQS